VPVFLRPNGISGDSGLGLPTNSFPLGVTASKDDRPPVAIAAQWVSQITGIGLEIVLPIFVGRWLDERWGTSFLVVVGVVVGPLLGFWHLLVLTGVVGGTKAKSDEKSKPRDRQL